MMISARKINAEVCQSLSLSMNNLYPVVLVIFCFLNIAALSAETICSKNFKACSENSDCCDGCCFQEKCRPYADECNKEENPCIIHECPPGKSCYLQQVQCVQAPCPPIPACRTRDPDYDEYLV